MPSRWVGSAEGGHDSDWLSIPRVEAKGAAADDSRVLRIYREVDHDTAVDLDHRRVANSWYQSHRRRCPNRYVPITGEGACASGGRGEEGDRVSQRRVEPQLLRIREMTLYIRASRVYHATKKRNQRDRDLHAQNLKMWRDACWQSYRQLFDTKKHLSQGSPWAFYSCRTSLKWA